MKRWPGSVLCLKTTTPMMGAEAGMCSCVVAGEDRRFDSRAVLTAAPGKAKLTAGREGFLPAGQFPAGTPQISNHVSQELAARSVPAPFFDFHRNGQRGSLTAVAGAATIRKVFF